MGKKVSIGLYALGALVSIMGALVSVVANLKLRNKKPADIHLAAQDLSPETAVHTMTNVVEKVEKEIDDFLHPEKEDK